MGAPLMGFEPWPLRQQPGVQSIRPFGRHVYVCLKTMSYTVIPQLTRFEWQPKNRIERYASQIVDKI